MHLSFASLTPRYPGTSGDRTHTRSLEADKSPANIRRLPPQGRASSRPSHRQSVVLFCETLFPTQNFFAANVHLIVLFHFLQDWAFDDGGVPSTEVIDKWVVLLKKRFSETPGSCVAVHCVAGLGRAPLLVALALMEAGMAYEDSVAFIRE